MATFSVPGAQLDVEFSDEHGHPVVQLHGLTSSRARDRVLDLDLGRGLSGTRLLRYDARAHGRSTGRAEPSDYRWPELANDLIALLDAWFPGERVHGVGPSMGCATLLYAASRHPDRFSGLTLMVPPTAWDTRPAKADEYRTNADLIEAEGLAAFLQRTPPSPPPAAAPGAGHSLPDVTEPLLPSLLRGAADSDLPTAAEIATINIPVSVLAWIDDPSHPLATAHTLAELLPQAQLSVAREFADVAVWPTVLREDVARS